MKSVEPIETADWLGVFENVFKASRDEFEDGKPSVWDYSNPDDFTSLWKNLEDGYVKKASCVLIIWSKTPSDESLLPVNTSEHVSPLHWAACVVKAASHIRICILDLNPSAHRGEYLYEHYLTCDKSRLPWLRVVQAAHLFGEEQSNGEFHSDVSPVEIEAVKKRLFPQLAPKRNLIRAGHFVDRIRENLTSPSSPDNRHAIANIIGPIVLLNGAPVLNEFTGDSRYVGELKQWIPKRDNSSADHRSALSAIFRATGLLPVLDTSEQQANNQNGNQGGVHEFSDRIKKIVASLPSHVKLRITLVDDQWHHGWYEWLKSIFPPETAYTVCSDPGFLVNKMEAVKDRHTDLRFKFDLTPPETETNANYADVLFLDLRLFSGNPVAEADFYRKLLPLCRKFEVAEFGSLVPVESPLRQDAGRRVENLAWPGFCSKELENVEAWIAGGNGRVETNHQVCLTLLPRLICLLDMSLPILLFSSTTKAMLLKRFEDYTVLSTDFQKPTFFDGADALFTCHKNFVAGFERCLGIANGREIVRRIINTAKIIPEDLMAENRKYKHFEIYFDEHGTANTDRFGVTALVIRYESEQQALELSSSLTQAGFSPFEAGEDGKPLTKIRDSLEFSLRQLPRLRNLLKNVDITVVQLFTTATSDSPLSIRRQEIITDHLCFDNTLRELASSILEIAFHLLLPQIGSVDEKLSVHVYGSRRLYPFHEVKASLESLSPMDWKSFESAFSSQLPATTMEEARNSVSLLKNKWGIQPERIEVKKQEDGSIVLLFRSIDEDGYFPIVLAAVQARPSNSLPWKGRLAESVERVVAFGHDADAGTSTGFRAQHFLADTVAAYCLDTASGHSWGPFQDGFVGQNRIHHFVQRLGAGFTFMMEASRACSRETLSKPIACWGAGISMRQEGADLTGLHTSGLEESVAFQIRESLPRITGAEFNVAANEFRKLLKTADYLQVHRVQAIDSRHQVWAKIRYDSPQEAATKDKFLANRLVVRFVKSRQKPICRNAFGSAVEAVLTALGFQCLSWEYLEGPLGVKGRCCVITINKSHDDCCCRRTIRMPRVDSQQWEDALIEISAIGRDWVTINEGSVKWRTEVTSWPVNYIWSLEQLREASCHVIARNVPLNDISKCVGILQRRGGKDIRCLNRSGSFCVIAVYHQSLESFSNSNFEQCHPADFAPNGDILGKICDPQRLTSQPKYTPALKRSFPSPVNASAAKIATTKSLSPEEECIRKWKGRLGTKGNFAGVIPDLLKIASDEKLRKTVYDCFPPEALQARCLKKSDPYWSSFVSKPDGVEVLRRAGITLQ